ncbi:GntR family transcriptional regulator [Cognatishimia sp. 1_MG-2023]|uniref:GntR family transcriptional regulator n=1 Tax=Cognatishimia sp. 1_MG-2023 TaxID=3062642 RepID=UPI0026E2BE1D|nr:GntR family transcriptional regulator [Cognatishimia sp. 1_MG-2023]MDO6727688.1 GntR family transcriptional regulator [Cognatishimia sp. 1_MG-2023]
MTTPNVAENAVLPKPYSESHEISFEDLFASMELGEETAPQMAVKVLQEAIVTGVLPSGASIKQDVIAEKLGTSKIPVREALRELEGQGLVNFYRNRGFVVSQTSADEMLEAFKLRRMLELFAVRESVPLSTDAHCEEIDAIIRDFELITDVTVSSHWNLKFHLALYAPARMAHLNRMIKRAHTIAHRYTHIYMRAHHATIDSQDEHRSILKAYKDQDVELAVTLMDSHISVASNEYAAFLKDYLE